jgi:hypothetical protein
MSQPKLLMPTFTDDLVLMNNNATHTWIRTDLSNADPGQFQCPLHVNFIRHRGRKMEGNVLKTKRFS